MKIMRVLFSTFALFLFLSGQVHALNCFVQCSSQAQAERPHRNHDCCDRAEEKDNDHSCNIEICVLSSHNYRPISVIYIFSGEQIKKIPANVFSSFTPLSLKDGINFSSHLSYHLSHNNKVPIVPSTPLFIRIKHLLI